MIKRRLSREIRIGKIAIGGDDPILVQSMCNTDTRDVESTVKQINRLTKAGCEIIRVAVPDMEAAKALGQIKKEISLPLVADIHFRHELALEAINQGVDKIRINPGNIGDRDKIKKVVLSAKEKDIPIRIGVNAGSLEKDILNKYNGRATAQAMVDSALNHISILEELDFKNIVVSLKASDVERTIEAYSLLADQIEYPLHLGLTEAGSGQAGVVSSSIGIGFLLYRGIGDTIRVSLTDDPIKEVEIGWEILKSLKLRKRGVRITSCPTCGRTEIDLISLVDEIKRRLENVDKDIHLAIMGCIVNGPGEAREADLALIGGKGNGLIMKKGKILRRVKEADLVEEILKEIDQFDSQN